MADKEGRRAASDQARGPRASAAGSPLAVLSDIHGNLRALDAILADMERRGIRRAVHLGDAVYGPLDPHGTAVRLIERGILSVRGNEDRLVVRADRPNALVDFVRVALRRDDVDWLCQLPSTLSLGDFLLCHGTPRDDAEYLLLDVTAGCVRLRDEAGITARLDGVAQRVVLCGHDHTPNAVMLTDGRLVVNPGSVGCPAYHDDHPVEHIIEAGSPHARYAIVARSAHGWSCEHICVPYDADAAATDARRQGRGDWAWALATGRALPAQTSSGGELALRPMPTT